MLQLPKSVTVVDVSARDGLQSFHRWVETDVKVQMVDRLSATGFPVVEVTNFAHPRVIPHLRDAEEVMERITRRPGIVYRAQAPNARGAERAVATKPGEILGLITASESYNRKNQNMTIEQGVGAALETFRVADRAGIPFVMAVGMAYWCAYDGPIPEERVLDIVGRLRNGGIRRYYYAGSLGVEDPRSVGSLIRRTLETYPDVEIGFHVHNLAGNGLANILAALDAGATFIEGAICGIGGGIMTPTTMGAVGNLATEDVVQFLNEMGIETGLDTKAVLDTAFDVAALLDIKPQSYVSAAGTRAMIMEDARASARQHPA
ncbi:hydroxymethylglutaryl-CoA lyase [Enterovirga rhinocerotis]|uniref:Hydroxymethylglutaryl-CoA lyase n=1 Tax=Enterovirga rhinocerotis TaxID=1339210 RepID=A0A4R7BT61_9HYPH|nr:hydroxymethylglutaryl-CoA lyase [Enterovirga rhinocerotis]TDR88092.1 hydroxymethylglutaryl-CoA lyase [Enterovirga rhinocerotis]